MYVLHQCAIGETPLDLKTVFDRTAAGKLSMTQWYYNSFEDGLNALTEAGWSLKFQLEDKESLEYYFLHDRSVQALCTYILPRKEDYFVFWRLTKWFNGSYQEWKDWTKRMGDIRMRCITEKDFKNYEKYLLKELNKNR